MLKKAKKSLQKNLSIFDIALIIFVVGAALFFFQFFRREGETIRMRVKVTDQDILYERSIPSSWYANQFQVGDTEKDTLGNVITEIVGVETFNLEADKKAVYLDLRVQGVYDTRSNTYTARGKKVAFGTPVRFNLDEITFDGYIVEYPGMYSGVELQTKDYIVTAIERGIDPEIISAIKVGEKIIDSNQNTLLEITDLSVKPSQQLKIVENNKEELIFFHQPLHKDIEIKAKVKVTIFKEDRFIFDNMPLKIGEELPVNLDKLSIFPIITSFVEAENNTTN